MHSFPNDLELRQKWLEICRVKDIHKQLYVCRRHFRPSFLHKKKISKDAFPELNLGLEDYDPLQVSDATDNYSTDEEYEEEHYVDDEDGSDDEENQDKSETTGNFSTDDEDEMEMDFEDEEDGRDDEINCNKCQVWKTRCQMLQQEIHAMRQKLNQLEQGIHLNEEDNDEEEQIWLLIK